MKVIQINITRGPNYWSNKRQRLVVMVLDIEEFEERPTDEIDGFYERLKEMFPGMYEHRCSEGVPGGFFERVKRGTWMGHVTEHLAIELQVMAGIEVGFGRARGTGVRGQYHVVFECSDDQTGRMVAEKALSIAQDLASATPREVKNDVAEIRESYQRHQPGPSTGAILEEASARNIPFVKTAPSSYQLGYGWKQKKIEATIASTTSNIAVETVGDKQYCKDLLDSMAIPVAHGASVASEEELAELVEEIGYPLVTKPVSGNHGRGVTTGIKTMKEAIKGFNIAYKVSEGEGVIVEKYVTGFDYRVLVIDYKLVAAARRTPAHVVGDGRSSIGRLIEMVNEDPRRGTGHDKVLTRIQVDKNTRSIFRFKGYTIDTVLAKDEVLYLNYAANLSTGGTATDVTEDLHPQVVAMAERLARVVGLDICGIDIMASHLALPLKDTGGVVLEVNAAPGFRMHLAPSSGKPRNVAGPVLDMLFPDHQNGRIPVLAVTGTNGKTTTTRLLAHIMRSAGGRVGFTTTEGVYVNGHTMVKGDCTGPRSAELVLRDPTVDTAVLECARGGMIRSGLAFSNCDVGIVTNVAADHLGMRGIDTLEKMARLKSLVPENVQANGYAVLNADDDLVYGMKEKVSCPVILFSMNASNQRILAHTAAGGISVVNDNGRLTIKDGEKTHRLSDAAAIPLTFQGKAGFMIENILAAVAGAYAQHVELDTIKKALMSFIPSAENTPGRMNLFGFPNFEVIVDYAHNPAGLLAIKGFLDRSSYTKKLGIVAAVGDRLEADSREVGRLAAGMFDEVIIREDNDLRGREPGELTEIVRAGIATATESPEVTSIPHETDALEYAMAHVPKGGLVLLCTENIDEVIAFMKKKQAGLEEELDKKVLQKTPHKVLYEDMEAREKTV